MLIVGSICLSAGIGARTFDVDAFCVSDGTCQISTAHCGGEFYFACFKAKITANCTEDGTPFQGTLSNLVHGSKEKAQAWCQENYPLGKSFEADAKGTDLTLDRDGYQVYIVLGAVLVALFGLLFVVLVLEWAYSGYAQL